MCVWIPSNTPPEGREGEVAVAESATATAAADLHTTASTTQLTCHARTLWIN